MTEDPGRKSKEASAPASSRSTKKRTTAAAQVPDSLTWHDARHEFVSSLIEEGGTIQEVKEAARHKSITTTAKYMKGFYEDGLRSLLERRANRLKQALDRAAG